MTTVEYIIITFVAALVLAIALPGCNDSKGNAWMKGDIRYGLVIPESRKSEAAAWIKSTVEAANPKSDEEPEDNIAQAEKTALDIFGKPTIGVLYYTRFETPCFVPYDQLSAKDRAACDEMLKAKP